MRGLVSITSSPRLGSARKCVLGLILQADMNKYPCYQCHAWAKITSSFPTAPCCAIRLAWQYERMNGLDGCTFFRRNPYA